MQSIMLNKKWLASKPSVCLVAVSLSLNYFELLPVQNNYEVVAALHSLKDMHDFLNNILKQYVNKALANFMKHQRPENSNFAMCNKSKMIICLHLLLFYPMFLTNETNSKFIHLKLYESIIVS